MRRRGFCPGVWAPMESGDGLIVRLRVPRARLEACQLQAVARAARAFGNGIIELTRRASLQIRGVSSGSLPSLQAELLRLGLAESSRAREERPAVLACPLAGLDARCPPLEPLAGALEAVLAAPELGPLLSQKFLAVVSGGSDLCDRVDADLRVELHRARPGVAELSLAGTRQSALVLGACRATHVPDALRTLLAAFDENGQGRRRMREVVLEKGVQSLRASLALKAVGEEVVGAGTQPREARPWAAPGLGFHSGLRDWLGFALPFGSANAEDWAVIAELAERFGSGEVRVTPTRVVLLPGVRELDRERLAERLRERHFIVEESVPTLHLAACSGAPACRSALGETRRLATELGALVREGLQADATLHVSGCEKSCAWGGAADITLVHAADGLRLGFGADVARASRTSALSMDAIRQRLASWHRGCGDTSSGETVSINTEPGS